MVGTGVGLGVAIGCTVALCLLPQAARSMAHRSSTARRASCLFFISLHLVSVVYRWDSI
jgi:hypothetical protein